MKTIQNTQMIRKRAWIDSTRRVVSFEQIRNASCYVAEERDFWNHIMELVSAGYALQ